VIRKELVRPGAPLSPGLILPDRWARQELW